MSEERTLANIAQTAYWTKSENQDTFDRVAKAVEKEVLARLNKSEFEPVAGQELTFVQTARWVEQHGSTKGLLWQDGDGDWWSDDDVKAIYASAKYRVAPKKGNDPDDPTTWEKGVVVLAGGGGFLKLGKFFSHNRCMDYPYFVDFEDYTDEVENAKLATPEQIEAWKLINGDL